MFKLPAAAVHAKSVNDLLRGNGSVWRSQAQGLQSLGLIIVAIILACPLCRAADRAAWMQTARFGVMTHYLADWRVAPMASRPASSIGTNSSIISTWKAWPSSCKTSEPDIIWSPSARIPATIFRPMPRTTS